MTCTFAHPFYSLYYSLATLFFLPMTYLFSPERINYTGTSARGSVGARREKNNKEPHWYVLAALLISHDPSRFAQIVSETRHLSAKKAGFPQIRQRF